MKTLTIKIFAIISILTACFCLPAIAGESGAFLEITLTINEDNRGAAAEVYKKYKKPFLSSIEGAKSKTLLIRTEDVQVLHGFKSVEDAKAYLTSEMFVNDVVVGLKPHLAADPEVRIYQAL